MFTTARRVTVNTLALLVARVSGLVLSMVFMAMLARHIGDTGMGQFYLAQSLTMITTVIADFGLSTLAVRDIARQRERASVYVTSLFTTKLALLVVALAITSGLAQLGGYSPEARQAIYVIVLFQSMEALRAVSTVVFMAYERMAYESLVQLVGNALYVGLGILGVALGYDLIHILLLQALAGGLKFALGIGLMLWRFVRPKLRVDWALSKYMLLGAMPFGVLAVISIMYENAHTLVLSYLSTEAAIGWYGAASRLTFILLIVPTAFMNAIFPVFSRLNASSQNALRVTYQKSFNYLFLLSLPISAGLFLISDQVIEFVYGPGFENAAAALRVLAWLPVLKFVGFASGAVLNATDHQKQFAMLEGAFMTTNVVLDVLFIRWFGFLGVCYARLVVSILDFIVYSLLCHRLVNLPFPVETLAKSAAATLAMGLVVFIVRDSAWDSMWLTIGLAAPVYLGALFLLRALPRGDIRAVYTMLFLRG
jgi:O-antigen/teichoic acid export membrane protein